MAEAATILKALGTFVFPIIGKLADLASPYFGGDATAQKLDNLRTTILPQIQVVIDAAEMIPMAGLKPWLNKLKVAALEAEDVFDEWEYKCLESQINGPSPLLHPIYNGLKKSKEFVSPIFLKTKLRKRLDDLEEIASGVQSFIEMLRLRKDFNTNQNVVCSRDPTVPSPPPIVVGRNQERDYWVHLLTSSVHKRPKSSNQNWRVPIYAICGIGGAGKTTLAQIVFNDPKVIEQFGDMRIWVHVPRNLDACQATREMVEFVTKGECPRMESFCALQAKLKETLEKSKNKILVVLDDLWDFKPEGRIELEKLFQPLNEIGHEGSMILITTRTERVASMLGATKIVPLNDLKAEDCWSIILHYAFGNAKITLEADLSKIIPKIVFKLKCSPIAARIIGIRLGSTVSVDAWSSILEGDVLESSKNALLWSLDGLPSHLKCCFVLCSLYPKGFRFRDADVDKLVRLWIAQGLVEEPTEEENLTIEEKGRQYFNELLSFSFFQHHPQRKGSYVIHDMLHDLAEDVSKGHCFRIDNSKSTNIPPTVIHLSIAARDKLDMSTLDIMKLVNLRTFFVLYISGNDFAYIIKDAEKIFEKLTKLRFLHFGGNFMRDLNGCIGKLKHLRYLCACVEEKLPESLGTLYHLQYLDLFHGSVNRFPKSLNNLVKLRCLLPPYKAYSKVEDIGQLTSSQELKDYNVDRTKNYGFQQLENLQQIRGRLELKGLENVSGKAAATVAMLNKKERLEKLVLRWDDNRDHVVDIERDDAVIEGLEPHPNLKKLEIHNCTGAKPPSWMLYDRGWLPNLISLKLKNCPNLTGVPNLPGHLKKLTVHDCPKLVQLCPFPFSLEELSMRDCPGAEALLYSASGGSKSEELQRGRSKGSSHQSSLPLKSLWILGCPIIEDRALNGFLMNNKLCSLSNIFLKNLPAITSLRLGPHLTALKDLHIVGLKNLSSVRGLGSLTSLEELTVYECPKLATTTVGGEGGGHITAGDCVPSSKRELKIDEPLIIPVLLQEQILNSLAQLNIEWCSQDVPFTADQEDAFLHLTFLKKLSFKNCENLPKLPRTLEKLSSLEALYIWNCPKIESLPTLPTSLQALEVKQCSKLESLPDLPASLESLNIWNCPKIVSSPDLPSPKSLFVWNCHPQL